MAATDIIPGNGQMEKKEDRAMAEQKVRTELEDDELVIDIGQLLRGMWKSFLKLWWLVLLLILAGAGGLFAWQRLFVSLMYRCSATFTVEIADGSSGSYSYYYDASAADQLSLTFPYILDSNFFRSALMEYLGIDSLNGTISAETISSSNMVTMTAESSSPEIAYAVLNAALDIYPETARFVLGDIQFNMIDEPEIPNAPYNRMSTRRCLAFGGGVGACAGICILGLLALFRRTARDPEEMKRITNLRCLALVPEIRFKARKNQKNRRISAVDERISYSYRESIRALQYRVEKEMKKKDGKVFLVTSTVSGEGKSTLAVGLAEMFASRGGKVLLIDGDLRKQDDARMMGLRPQWNGGLEAALKGTRPLSKMIRRNKKTNIYFLGGSKPVKQPAGMLSGRNIQRLLDTLRRQVDYIIIDTPPCGMFQDAGIFAEYADGILYVVRYDYVPQQEVQAGFSSLQGRGAVFLGYVFNYYPEISSEYGYGKYGHGSYGYGKYGYRKYESTGYRKKQTGD